MRPNNNAILALIAALAGGLLFGLWKLYEFRFASGDIYPQYSSLRSDALGTKALYESLEQIPDVAVTRNYKEFSNLPHGNPTVLILGESPFAFEAMAEDGIKEYETLAQSGARVLIAMRPVNRQREKSPNPLEEKKPREAPEIEKRWGVEFGYVPLPDGQADSEGADNPKLTSLYFRYQGQVVRRLERKFGSGAIVLLASCYPMSNEALASERDTKTIAWALGENRKIIFDEHHLGLAENSGVMTLARKYHLEGLGVVLLVLLLLFIWKNSVSLLPPRAENATEDSVVAMDARSGLANLLRRNIPTAALIKTCFEEWDGSRRGASFYSEAKVRRVRDLAERDQNAVETYRKISRILAERSEA
ncbi:MAG TPA: DUF4350 domain-containing protein [Bryobacteraceae bacterium]|nr:DUF4350 domain-containing protein [Bryobacteraceae bacterium]